MTIHINTDKREIEIDAPIKENYTRAQILEELEGLVETKTFNDYDIFYSYSR